MSFWCLQFLPKNEQKQVDLRFHSSKVELVRSFSGRNVSLKKSFRPCLTFSPVHLVQDLQKFALDLVVVISIGGLILSYTKGQKKSK